VLSLRHAAAQKRPRSGSVSSAANAETPANWRFVAETTDRRAMASTLQRPPQGESMLHQYAMFGGLSLIAFSGAAFAQGDPAAVDYRGPKAGPTAPAAPAKPGNVTPHGDFAPDAAATGEGTRARRIVVESVAALGAEAALGVASGLVTLCACEPMDSSCVDPVVAALAAGGSAGAIGGVLAVGTAMKGNGSAPATMLGGFAGGAIGFFVLRYGTADTEFGRVAIAMALPVIGSVLGYELTSDGARPAERASVPLRVGFVPDKGGGLVSAFGQF
jgi:hypothetical protein